MSQGKRKLSPIKHTQFPEIPEAAAIKHTQYLKAPEAAVQKLRLKLKTHAKAPPLAKNAAPYIFLSGNKKACPFKNSPKNKQAISLFSIKSTRLNQFYPTIERTNSRERGTSFTPSKIRYASLHSFMITGRKFFQPMIP